MSEPSATIAHCPSCGRAVRGERSNPFRCADCGFVLFFNAASAVAAFIVDAAGRILYTRRAKEPGKGRLGMPGGFVDIGESAEEALRREVLEEVGLTLGGLTYLTSHPNRYRYAGVTYTTLDLFFVARQVDVSDARPLDATASLEWLDPAQVDEADIAFESMRRALADYRRRLDA
jgi:ADP-ribose pyrophosphatase YjhB (NUDIX family)